jgi:hypothetical protein
MLQCNGLQSTKTQAFSTVKNLRQTKKLFLNARGLQPQVHDLRHPCPRDMPEQCDLRVVVDVAVAVGVLAEHFVVPIAKL